MSQPSLVANRFGAMGRPPVLCPVVWCAARSRHLRNEKVRQPDLRNGQTADGKNADASGATRTCAAGICWPPMLTCETSLSHIRVYLRYDRFPRSLFDFR